MNERHESDKLEIVPLKRPPSAAIAVPGSKSITNRALVLAALASRQGPCTLTGALQCDDTKIMIECLRRLGFRIQTQWDHPESVVTVAANSGPIIPATEADLFAGNSGTTMRFLTAIVAAGHGRYRIDGDERMRQRPIGDLLTALRQLGVDIRCECDEGYPPVVVKADGLRGGSVTMRGDVSSQFLSGLLMASPLAVGDVEINIDGFLVSNPYVFMTTTLMDVFGARSEAEGISRFRVPSQQKYSCEQFRIDQDGTAVGYFHAAAAITGGRITAIDVSPQRLQGDLFFGRVLEWMGCRVEWCDSGITVHGRPLHGIDVDMNDISDCVPTLAAVACFAEGPTTIRNVAHIRHKESDRIAALTTELRKVGAEVEEFPDGFTITPRPLHGAEIETYNDHRIAMSMALIGLKVPGIVIRNPGCVAKTYPGFWDDLENLGT